FYLDRDELVEGGKLFGSWEPWSPTWQTKLAILFRRFPFTPWFQPIVRLGETGTEEYVLDQSVNKIDKELVYRLLPTEAEPVIAEKPYLRPSNEIRSNNSQAVELFIFVNDGVIGLPGLWDLFYRGNTGTGILTVTKTADAPIPTPDTMRF